MSAIEHDLSLDEARGLLATHGFIFDNEDGTYWIGAEGRTEEQALAEVRELEPASLGEGEPAVCKRRGRVGVNEYDEHRLNLDAEGPIEVWEVEFP